MPFSMSSPRGRALPRTLAPQPVTVWGYGIDGGEGGLPVVVARGRVEMNYDGPQPCRVTGEDGSVYATSGPSWAPLAGEWTVEATRTKES